MNLGRYARWYCDGCSKKPRQGRFPCRLCCGYTAKRSNHIAGVTTAYGHPNPRNLS